MIGRTERRSSKPSPVRPTDRLRKRDRSTHALLFVLMLCVLQSSRYLWVASSHLPPSGFTFHEEHKGADLARLRPKPEGSNPHLTRRHSERTASVTAIRSHIDQCGGCWHCPWPVNRLHMLTPELTANTCMPSLVHSQRWRVIIGADRDPVEFPFCGASIARGQPSAPMRSAPAARRMGA
jgi:hypothetical protein